METAIAREQGVLKLVHPGRHVEIHTTPIPAADVLNKYPRYCITRPDVFKFPWIVVKPESVLVPGRVFFLVPKRTVYDLIKANMETHRQQLKSHAGMTPKHLNYDGNRFRTSYWDGEQTPEYDLDKRHKIEHFQVEKGYEGIFKYEESLEEIQSPYVNAYEFYYNKDDQLTKKDKQFAHKNHDSTSLKSCLRKPNSARLLNLRVTFMLPD